MKIKLERIQDLFEDFVDELLDIVEEPNNCHWNSAMVCHQFKDWDCIDYCEGYLKGYIGHAWNVYTDANGNKHYFDITQESNYANGLVTEFCDELELVTEISADDIIEQFNKDGYGHLVSVEVIAPFEQAISF